MTSDIGLVWRPYSWRKVRCEITSHTAPTNEKINKYGKRQQQLIDHSNSFTTGTNLKLSAVPIGGEDHAIKLLSKKLRWQGSSAILKIYFQTFSRPFPDIFRTFSRPNISEWPTQIKYRHYWISHDTSKITSILNKLSRKCLSKDQVWKIIFFFRTNRQKNYFSRLENDRCFFHSF